MERPAARRRRVCGAAAQALRASMRAFRTQSRSAIYPQSESLHVARNRAEAILIALSRADVSLLIGLSNFLSGRGLRVIRVHRGSAHVTSALWFRYKCN